MTTCSRFGCTKKLRSNNTTGMCATSCESAEAPASSRAKDVLGGKPPRASRNPSALQVSTPPQGSAVELFRKVAEAVGRDPDAILEEFAQSWLDGLRQALEG